MRKNFKFFLLLTALFVLVGCTKTLDTPTNVRISDDVVHWDQVKEATGYVVKVGVNEHSTATNSFDLKTLTLDTGTYQISVKATGKDKKDSKFSGPVSYVVDATTNKLETPANLVITDGVLTWNQVTGANAYLVSVNGVQVRTQQPSIDVADFVIKIGNYPVTVIAVGNGTVENSEPAQVTLNFNQNLLTLKTNELINIMLEPYGWVIGMKASDFDLSDEYEYYLEVVARNQELVEEFIKEEIVLNTFKKAQEIIVEIQESDEPYELIKQVLQNFDSYGISTDQLASLLLIANKQSLTSWFDNYEDMIAFYEQRILEREERIDLISENYYSLLDDLQYFVNNIDGSVIDYVQLYQEYHDIILTNFNLIEINPYEYYIYYDFKELVDFITRLYSAQYMLDLEYGKGEDALPHDIEYFEQLISEVNMDIIKILELFEENQLDLQDFVQDLGEKYYQILVYRDAHPDLVNLINDVTLFFSDHIENELYYLIDISQRNAEIADLQQSILDYEANYAQNQLMLSILDHKNIKELMKMNINQMLVLIDELNWELIEAFIETLDEKEPPAPAFLAEVVQEAARLLRIATDYDQGEYVDLALTVLLSVIPEITEDQQLAIRSLAAHSLPAVTDVLISVIENIDESAITKLFTLIEIDQNDDSKVEDKESFFVNPDFIIVLADMYNSVLAQELLELVTELETAYESIAVLYPGIPEFDFETIKTQLTEINAIIAEVAGYQIIEVGYYTASQLEKMIEAVTKIMEFAEIFGVPAPAPFPV